MGWHLPWGAHKVLVSVMLLNSPLVPNRAFSLYKLNIWYCFALYLTTGNEERRKRGEERAVILRGI